MSRQPLFPPEQTHLISDLLGFSVRILSMGKPYATVKDPIIKTMMLRWRQWARCVAYRRWLDNQLKAGNRAPHAVTALGHDLEIVRADRNVGKRH